jgi:SAM-dependent methyltransferase
LQYDDPNTYSVRMLEAFLTRYREARDRWTGEAAMSRAGELFAGRFEGYGLHVLDIGTGRGRDALLYARMGHDVLGLDLISCPDWESARDASPGKLEFRAGDFLSYESGRLFDVVCDNGCLHHQHPAHYGPYLEKVRALLRHGGTYCVNLFEAPAGAASGALVQESDGRLSRIVTRMEAENLLASHRLAPAFAMTVDRQRAESRYLVIAAHAI